MIDLHTHILPDIDDGAASLEVALAMARAAVADGITVVAATPHSPESTMGGRYSAGLVAERLAELRAALAEEQIPLTVVGGTEITIASELVPRLRVGALLPYEGSRALLLECPGAHMPEGLPDTIFALQAAGYRVVLAHPERLKEVQRDPHVLLPLVERGTLMQLTAETLLGRQGATLERTAEALLTHNLVHVLASDAHGMPPRRALRLAAPRARAASLIGEEAATALVLDTPDALLHNRPLTLPPPLPAPARKKWWMW